MFASQTFKEIDANDYRAELYTCPLMYVSKVPFKIKLRWQKCNIKASRKLVRFYSYHYEMAESKTISEPHKDIVTVSLQYLSESALTFVMSHDQLNVLVWPHHFTNIGSLGPYLTPPLCIEMPVPRQESIPSCIWVLGLLMLSFSKTILFPTQTCLRLLVKLCKLIFFCSKLSICLSLMFLKIDSVST